jgi:recombinational DNA repair protein RecT
MSKHEITHSQQSASAATVKHWFAQALNDFGVKQGANKSLLDTPNALTALQAIAAHYPQVDAIEAAQLACIYIGQNWDAAGLKTCDPATILGAYMQLCNLGIVLRSVQPLAYLVNKGGKCTIYIGADGYQLLARRNYPNMRLRTEYVTPKEYETLRISKDDGDGKKMSVTHNLDVCRDPDTAVAMYAVLYLDGSKDISDIILMNAKERDKYVALHKGGVWKMWAANMWATKLTKKIFKGLGLADPDGTIASVSMNTDSDTIDITACEYESEFDVLLQEIEKQLADCQSEAAIKELYADFKKKAKALGGDATQFVNLFTTRNNELKAAV